MKNKTKSRLKWVIIILSFVMSLTMFSAFIVGLTDTETTTLNRFDYSIGTIDETTGKALDSKYSVYTENYEKVDGLVIELVDEPTVNYSIFFYDEDKTFLDSIDCTGDFEVETAESVPEGATYFRVVITPYEVDEEPVEITVVNKAKYTKQLDISFNK